MVRKIVKYKHSKLKRKSEPVNGENILKLKQDMLDTCKANNGVGLAAIQIGVRKRIALIAPRGQAHYFIINPEIIEKSDRMVTLDESCLSAKGKWGKVKRYKDIVFEFTDEAGQRISGVVEGMEARIVQHECDHMDGIVCVDKFGGEK